MAIQDKRTEKRKLGDIGENIACDFLKRRGFEIVERNYLKKWGEIDIITKKADVIHFVEVKSARLPAPNVAGYGGQVSRVTDNYRPEDNMHPWKLRRLSRVIQTYLLDRKLDCDWQLDLITVKIDVKNRKARVEIIENIII
jgi:putative endonuclease